MTQVPKVSILIPTFNYAHYLEDSIPSALNQTYTDFELIILDNASTDNTKEVVAKYLSDPRVSYYRNETNIGVVGNFNLCLELANCEYIKFLCADDKFEPTIVEKYVAVMDANPGVSLVTCDKQAFGSKSHETITPLTHRQSGTFAVLQMVENNYCWIGEPTSVMFRKRDLTIGKFSNDFKQYVDWDFWNRLLSVGDCYIIPEKLVQVRFHMASISKASKKKRFILCFEEYRISKDVQRQEYGINTAGSRIDEAVKKRALACIRAAMLKTIPELYKKEPRMAFRKAFKIAKEEKLFSAAFTEFFSGLKRKAQRQLTN